uniref:PDZ domain-containing protein n=1 Tax=Timema monikensis TaxID=170555 RepID=A0A7R9E6Q7_9NEOP|nr:unnamed protein product [Timema monikensis]
MFVCVGELGQVELSQFGLSVQPEGETTCMGERIRDHWALCQLGTGKKSTFEACVLKGSRGLGLSVTGGVDTKEQWPGLIRIKRLFPHQPAWQTGQLSQGDILLAANGVALSGLSNYSYNHPAVTLAQPSVEGLKLAKGAQRNPRNVESLFLTCLRQSRVVRGGEGELTFCFAVRLVELITTHLKSSTPTNRPDLCPQQALEVLRKTPSSVVLTVCRPPSDVFSDPPPSEPPPPPRRDPAHSITGRTAILPLPPLQTEGPTGEFDIHLTKVNHSLGFTLRKEDESVLGHYVRALVREPALSDGRIRPGDKIVAVNDVDISPMSHEEAVMFLRQCGDHVKLRLYRDAAQTPVSALSPTEESKLFRPKPILRKEAMDMLCDLAVRKLSPGDNSTGSSSYTRLRRVSDGQSSSSPSSSPRRRKLTKTPSPDAQPLTQERIAQKYLVSSHVGNSDSSGEGSNTNTCTYQSSFDSTAARGRGSSFASSEEGGGPELRPQRPNFLDLCGASSLPGTARKQRFTFSTDGEEEGSLCHTGSDEPDTLGSVSRLCPSDDEAADRCDLPLEPTSMPPLTNLSSTSSTSTAFSYRNPAYQSACPAMRGKVVEEVHEHASDQDIPGKVFGSCPGGAEGTRGLLKWKGVVFTPESDPAEEDVIDEGETIKSTGECLKQKQREGQGSVLYVHALDLVSLNIVLVFLDHLMNRGGPGHRDTERDHMGVFMVELTRGWNSRLGFSLQSDGSDTYISAIYADSVAAKDGRLRAGDQVIMVNDEDITNMTTSDLIDLLRKIRGTIGITVLRKTGPRPRASPDDGVIAETCRPSPSQE